VAVADTLNARLRHDAEAAMQARGFAKVEDAAHADFVLFLTLGDSTDKDRFFEAGAPSSGQHFSEERTRSGVPRVCPDGDLSCSPIPLYTRKSQSGRAFAAPRCTAPWETCVMVGLTRSGGRAFVWHASLALDYNDIERSTRADAQHMAERLFAELR
jgi:hypothetical protein